MANNKFVNNNGQMERKIDFSLPKGYEKISGAKYPTRQLQLENYSNVQPDPSNTYLYGKPIGRTEAFLPQGNVQAAAMPQTQTSPIDNFNLLLTNMLSKAQGVSTTDLLKRRRDLQKASLERQMAPTPEALKGELSYNEMTGLKTASAKALSSDIDKNAYDIAKAEEATKNFEFIFNQARQLGEEFAKTIVAPQQVIDSYLTKIYANPNNMEDILANADVNNKTKSKIIDSIDYNKINTGKRKEEEQKLADELKLYAQKKAVDQQYKTPSGSGGGGGTGGTEQFKTDLDEAVQALQTRPDMYDEIKNRIYQKYGNSGITAFNKVVSKPTQAEIKQSAEQENRFIDDNYISRMIAQYSDEEILKVIGKTADEYKSIWKSRSKEEEAMRKDIEEYKQNYINKLKNLVKQYRTAGYTDKEILKELQ